jgi:hypothetical protein
MAIGMGEAKEKVRAMMIEVRCMNEFGTIKRLTWLQKMIQPVGKPPEVQD